MQKIHPEGAHQTHQDGELFLFWFFKITGVSHVFAGCFYPIFLNHCDPLKAEISAAKNSSITSDGSSACTEPSLSIAYAAAA